VLIETRDGATLIGFIESQKGNSITLCDANGVRWPIGDANIQSQYSVGISGMPEGLEAGLNQQNMADLLEYLTVNPP
jgi:putative heme-binding domain-containing protein